MRAGEKRTRITLKKPVRTRNASLEWVTSYSDVATVWARVEWQSGRRFEEAKKLNAEVQGVIGIDYRTDVKADWRIGYGSRTVEILSLANVREMRRELVLWCKEAKG
jgi:SPP1 family predicted phage head-tail adaptor